MQLLSPLLDATGTAGTAGQSLGSNGVGATPSWRSSPLYDRLSPPAVAETAVVSSTTLTLLGRRYAVTSVGTAIIVTLPQAVSGNLGQSVSIRVIPTSTAIHQVTSTTSTVGGRTAGDFRLYAGESVDLESDGTNWVVRPGGVCIPASCGRYLSAAGTCAAAAYARVAFDSTDNDTTGLMAGVVTNAISIPRKGRYMVTYKVLCRAVGGGGVAAMTNLFAFLQVNQATVGAPNPYVVYMTGSLPSGGIGGVSDTVLLNLNAGDYLHVGVNSSAVAVSIDPGITASSLRVVEVPGW